MARAYLNIGSDLLRVFNNAQETKDHRLIIAKIKDEDILYDTSYMIEDTLENDFNNLTQNFTDNEPCFALFNLSSNLESSLNSNSLSWLLLSWVPDNSKVKLKMLYSSSVEDVKQALGLSYFSSDFHCSERTELSWSFYEKYNKNNKEFDIGLLSEKERLILEEKVIKIFSIIYHSLIFFFFNFLIIFNTNLDIFFIYRFLVLKNQLMLNQLPLELFHLLLVQPH